MANLEAYWPKPEKEETSEYWREQYEGQRKARIEERNQCDEFVLAIEAVADNTWRKGAMVTPVYIAQIEEALKKVKI